MSWKEDEHVCRQKQDYIDQINGEVEDEMSQRIGDISKPRIMRSLLVRPPL